MVLFFFDLFRASRVCSCERPKPRIFCFFFSPFFFFSFFFFPFFSFSLSLSLSRALPSPSSLSPLYLWSPCGWPSALSATCQNLTGMIHVLDGFRGDHKIICHGPTAPLSPPCELRLDRAVAIRGDELGVRVQRTKSQFLAGLLEGGSVPSWGLEGIAYCHGMEQRRRRHGADKSPDRSDA